RRVRPLGEARLRLRARLARRRSPAVGQSLLVARAQRFSLERAPADAAHHGQGHGAAVLRRRARRRHRLSKTITLETNAPTSRIWGRRQAAAMLRKSSLR